MCGRLVLLVLEGVFCFLSWVGSCLETLSPFVEKIFSSEGWIGRVMMYVDEERRQAGNRERYPRRCYVLRYGRVAICVFMGAGWV